MGFYMEEEFKHKRQECTRGEERKQGAGMKYSWRNMTADYHPSHPQSLDYRGLDPPRYGKPRRDWQENCPGPC